jgi:hypothetical protein
MLEASPKWDNLQTALRPVVLTERLVRQGVGVEAVQQASGRVELVTSKITDGTLTGESGESSFFSVYVMTLMMYFRAALLRHPGHELGA